MTGLAVCISLSFVVAPLAVRVDDEVDSNGLSAVKGNRCGDGHTIWRNNMGNKGACNSCNPPVPMRESDAQLWTCDNEADIALNLSGTDARKCLSWSTEGICEWPQQSILAMQANLVSEHCNGLWVAPLWMTPRNWKPPQHATGEIDFFERGCSRDSGYLLSFGESGSFIDKNAWDEQGAPDRASRFTAYMQFNRSADVVTAYKCPYGSTPMSTGPEAAGCSLTVTRRDYYRSTAWQTSSGAEMMHLVSDVWNACPRLDCGNFPAYSQCSFHVSGVKVKLDKIPPNAPAACNALWVGDGPAPAPPAPPPSSSSTCEKKCWQGGHDYSCHGRVEWMSKMEGLQSALARVNRDCVNQCSCTSMDFGASPQPVSPQPTPSATCANKCYQGGSAASCHGRVGYLAKTMSLQAALARVNSDCTRQCECTTANF
eukprot:TRINITY_DN52184_c0_g1_i1.p1 TRINITY_DN52184_c0_g1~~TRINITY_DN52184_c0_g1_i1.p1  ORF type:complete len:428 (-),score=43.78 TRINITY_DN52184_c0_g1_i1:26-1309(-)